MKMTCSPTFLENTTNFIYFYLFCLCHSRSPLSYNAICFQGVGWVGGKKTNRYTEKQINMPSFFSPPFLNQACISKKAYINYMKIALRQQAKPSYCHQQQLTTGGYRGLGSYESVVLSQLYFLKATFLYPCFSEYCTFHVKGAFSTYFCLEKLPIPKYLSALRKLSNPVIEGNLDICDFCFSLTFNICNPKGHKRDTEQEAIIRLSLGISTIAVRLNAILFSLNGCSDQ